MNSLINLKNLKRAEIISDIKKAAEDFQSLNFMEVCGTHTMQIYRAGIPSILPSNINLLSGPGCPVCVTPEEFIDKAIAYLKEGYEILTFGDLYRVPGTYGSLEKECSGKVKIIYSPSESLEYALNNSDKKFILLAVGFETTAPLFAAVVIDAKKKGIKNLFLLCALKLIPPVMRYLLETGELKIDGFLLPGHVATIIGSEAFRKVCDDYKKPGVVSGFEPEDILQSIFILLMLLKYKSRFLEIQYRMAVKREGNVLARREMEKVFQKTKAKWRGIGEIENSGLTLKEEFIEYDISYIHPLKIESQVFNPRCRCGEVLRGIISPVDCPLFDNGCSPQTPQGPCMVSSEGACAAIYKYGRE